MRRTAWFCRTRLETLLGDLMLNVTINVTSIFFQFEIRRSAGSSRTWIFLQLTRHGLVDPKAGTSGIQDTVVASVGDRTGAVTISRQQT